MKRILQILALFTAFVVSSAASVFAQNARLPYSYLYHVQKVQADIAAAYPNLHIVLRLRSTSPDIRPDAIHAVIDSKSGKIPLAIGSDGGFSVPLRDDLLAEDPWVVTDQPRGTMELNWQGGLARRLVQQMTNSIHYATVMGALEQCEQVQDKMRVVFPNAPRTVASGLKLTFSASQPSAIILIRSREGIREIKASDDGTATVPLLPELMSEDPVMSFSAPPKKVELVFRPRAD